MIRTVLALMAILPAHVASQTSSTPNPITTLSPTTDSPTVSPSTIIEGVGCRAHRHCGPNAWCRTDNTCIFCNRGNGDICVAGDSISGVCPGKCGTLPPTAATSAPSPRPAGFCNVHRVCPTNNFCNSNNQCSFCTLCTDATSVSGVCPFKCLSIIAQNQPTPPTLSPTAAPTLNPSSASPVPAPFVPGCRNHRHCPITDFCSSTQQCFPCANCTSASDSVNGNCPPKCTTRAPAQPASNSCTRHFHCSSTQFCHSTVDSCVPCVNFVVNGNAPANCSAGVSTTGQCPSKCLQVLSPGGATTSQATAAGSSAGGSSSAGVAAGVVAAALVVVAAALLAYRRQRGVAPAADKKPADTLAWDGLQTSTSI